MTLGPSSRLLLNSAVNIAGGSLAAAGGIILLAGDVVYGAAQPALLTGSGPLNIDGLSGGETFTVATDLTLNVTADSVGVTTVSNQTLTIVGQQTNGSIRFDGGLVNDGTLILTAADSGAGDEGPHLVIGLGSALINEASRSLQIQGLGTGDTAPHHRGR